MALVKGLKAVTAQAGHPLYLAVKDAVRAAIDAGVFHPGEQMPSTKELSEQMGVSLVTAHRALQELVTSGVLQRSQGKGTFVHEKYFERNRALADARVGLVFHRESSLADFYHSQILEGIHQAAQALGVDLVLLRFGEDVRKECNGFLLVNPLPDELESLTVDIGRKMPTLVVGAKSTSPSVASVDVDNVELARSAVDHLASLGHTRIMYAGGADNVSNSRDRWQGFQDAYRERGLLLRDSQVFKSLSWRLDDRERNSLVQSLTAPNRPTAIFAAGYYFALDVYGAAATVGLRIPEDLSVVGVDDPPSAAHLSPPMTTLRQPLIQLGHAAITALADKVQHPNTVMESRQLRAQLVIRRSRGSAAVANTVGK